MLDNLNKQNPFKTPENYFNDFHTEMMSKIQGQPKAKVIPLWKKVLPWTGIAAMVCGIVISVSVLMFDSVKETKPQRDDIEMLASSSSDDEYFKMYIEEEAVNASYDEIVYTKLGTQY